MKKHGLSQATVFRLAVLMLIGLTANSKPGLTIPPMDHSGPDNIDSKMRVVEDHFRELRNSLSEQLAPLEIRWIGSIKRHFLEAANPYKSSYV